MLTHEQLMKAKLYITPEGDVFNIDENGEELQLVFTNKSIHPEFVNLLRSSAIMYQTTENLLTAFDALLENLRKDFPEENLAIQGFVAMRNTLQLTKNCVLFGIENVADGLRGFSTNIH